MRCLMATSILLLRLICCGKNDGRWRREKAQILRCTASFVTAAYLLYASFLRIGAPRLWAFSLSYLIHLLDDFLESRGLRCEII